MHMSFCQTASPDADTDVLRCCKRVNCGRQRLWRQSFLIAYGEHVPWFVVATKRTSTQLTCFVVRRNLLPFSYTGGVLYTVLQNGMSMKILSCWSPYMVHPRGRRQYSLWPASDVLLFWSTFVFRIQCHACGPREAIVTYKFMAVAFVNKTGRIAHHSRRRYCPSIVVILPVFKVCRRYKISNLREEFNSAEVNL